ncbi:Predicted arabinose efflux permease, MFS family [Mycobacterium numidiamassiliense]|uniref:Predicted arabinose efflux permease, MFS family n=2 Tax=Mycobacterium numidiamassiliense TaxID=1841861 RepID=A0A2U3PI73_9MYCO|nr:Predicted arabinose efflux permease, MFS family [Mycobacterium numidiamassiliense]
MVVAIMVSMVAFLDSNIVNLGLPATARDLGGGLSLQQWVVDGYLLALAVAILPGGSISDLFGRVPVLRFGLAAFGLGSVLAAAAACPTMLIIARLVQGLGGAFLVPGSLALINSAFDRADRAAAIGSWTAWTSTAFALGPLLGGLAVDFLGWRWIYLLLAIPVVIGFALTFWLCPIPAPAQRVPVDVPGVALSAVGLGATVYALIESHRRGWTSPLVATLLVVGVTALFAFVVWQRRTPHPMVPPKLFAIRNVAGANLATAFVYGGLTLGSIAMALYLQEAAGYSAILAGLITLPTPIASFLFARRVGRAATRMGPRLFLVAGPLVAGLGLLLICPTAHDFGFATHLLPGRLVLAAGLVLTITPLSSVVLLAVEPAHSGVAAAIQNAVGRTSALAAVACVGLIAAGPLTDGSFTRLMQVAAALYFVGAAVACVTITNPIAVAEPAAAKLPPGDEGAGGV